MMSATASINGGRRHPITSQGPRPPSAFICCNRCGKELSTTVFVCSCLCIFCEECTFDHFTDNENCPTCGQSLSEKDFMELVVADPSSVTAASTKSNFQTLFTKKSSSAQSLEYSDMCVRLMKQANDLQVETRFLLKQLVKDSNALGERTSNLGRAYETVQKQNIQLKQAQSAQRLEMEKTIADLQHQLQARAGAISELQAKLEEKENMLNKFRKIHGGGGNMGAVPPSSSHSQLRVPVSSSGQHRDHQHHGSQPSPFLLHQHQQQQQQASSRQDAIRLNVLGRANSFNSSTHHQAPQTLGVTPIQISPRPYSTAHSPGLSVAGTPRIRQITSSTGYVFTSRHGGGGGGAGGDNNGNNHRGHPANHPSSSFGRLQQHLDGTSNAAGAGNLGSSLRSPGFGSSSTQAPVGGGFHHRGGGGNGFGLR